MALPVLVGSVAQDEGTQATIARTHACTHASMQARVCVRARPRAPMHPCKHACMYACTHAHARWSPTASSHTPAHPAITTSVLKVVPKDPDALRAKVAALLQLSEWEQALQALARAPAAVAGAMQFERVRAAGCICVRACVHAIV